MARSTRHSGLETRTARFRLKEGERHPVTIGQHLILIYRRGPKSSTWLAKASLDGKKYAMKSLGQADDTQDANGVDILNYFQAQEAAKKFATDYKMAQGILSGPLTVEEAAKHYLEWFKEHRKSYKDTVSTVEAHILPHFGKKLVSELKSNDIKAWLNKLATQPSRRRTRPGLKQAFAEKPVTDEGKRARKASANRILTVLKAILNKAFADDLASDDKEWRKVKPFENADEPITRFLTEAESIRLVNASRPDFAPLVKAALFTGARYGELSRMLAENFNPDTGMVYIRPSKSGKARYIPLSAEGQDFFKTQAMGKKRTDPMFTKENGEVWGKSHHIRDMKEACRNARIEPPIGFHELRHTYASLLAQAGADLLTISKLLGHADTRITSRHYAHLCDKTLSNTVKNLLPGFGHVSDGKVKAIR